MAMKHVRASVLTAATLAGISGQALAARVDYTVDLGVEDNDNVTLAPFDPIQQRYLRAGVGFSVEENVSALQMNFDGRVEYRDYQDNVFTDTVDGTLSGRVNWVAIPERLFITAEDNLSVQPVDALAPDAPGNRQQVNVFSVGPTLLFSMGQALHGQAELRYINSSAEETDEFNSQRLAGALRAIKDLSATSQLSANLQIQQVNFDDDVFGRDYNRYDIYGRYTRTLAHFQLGLDLGYSRLDYRSGGENRSEPLIRFDAEWNPTTRSSINLLASSQFSDTATDALRDVSGERPPNTIPDNILTGDAVVNASPYEVRSLDLGYTYTGTRLNFSATPYVQKRNYVDSDEFDQDSQGARVDVHWIIRQFLTVSAYGTYEKLDYTSLDRQDTTTRLGATLSYQWAPRWSGHLMAERYERDSTDVGQDVSQTLIYLSVSYSNRP